MSIQMHVKSLSAKHAKLEDVISTEEHRPIPDTMRLSTLKKQKLKIKEEINQLQPRH